MTQYAIQTKALNFGFSKSKKIIDNLSINVPKGSIYGFLGPNGAGKSTTMRLLTGILPDDSNSIEIFGQSLQNQLPYIFENVGCLVESPALYLHLSGYDNLRYIALMRNVAEESIEKYLEIVDLQRSKHMKAKRYSLGMKQRLAIAMALLNNPSLLLLDEPVNGLDPNGMLEIRNLLIKLNKEFGTTIFVSSHLLSEIEKMCTHVGIISHGKLQFEGTMKELSDRYSDCKVQIFLRNLSELSDKIKEQFPEATFTGDKAIFTLANKEAIPELVKQLVQLGAEIYELKPQEGLEESFMLLTK
ncbi:ABC transporter ATP-binding protein [Capnocytophaga canis]|uniref:ABC transporter ATP-binding protein n=1 Tax=Capnocytophaga canis TaxID=1848903 RepID=UPI00370D19C8